MMDEQKKAAMDEQKKAAMDEQKKAALAMIRAVYEDGEAEINGRVYTFNEMKHKQRLKVFAFYTQVSDNVQRGNFGFLATPEFENVEKVLNDVITFDGSLLSRLGEAHWEKHPDDYLTFISTALPVISYPFFSASVTG